MGTHSSSQTIILIVVCETRAEILARVEDVAEESRRCRGGVAEEYFRNRWPRGRPTIKESTYITVNDEMSEDLTRRRPIGQANFGTLF